MSKKFQFSATIVAAISMLFGNNLTIVAAQEVSPIVGGTVIYYQDIEPDDWNPSHDNPVQYLNLSSNVVERLVHMGADGNYYPWLAQEWSISADSKTYTFKLRDNVAFHNGERLNAAAVIANFDNWKNDPNSYSLDNLGVLAYRQVDDMTVEIELKEARAQTLWSLSYSWGILAPEAVTEHAASLSGDATKLIGTGPFIAESYTRGQGLTLVRNENYASPPGDSPNQGLAYLDEVVVSFVPDPAVRVGVLTSNQADVIANVPAIFLSQIEASADYEVHRMQAPGIPFQVSLNTQRPPLDDLAVRQALRSSLDIKTALDTIYFGQYPQAWSILSASTPAYDATQEGSWTFDVAEANLLLDEAGWTERDADGIRSKDGVRLELNWAVRAATVEDQRDILAEALQAMAREAGISILREPMDSGAYTNAMREGAYNITDRAASTPDPYILRRLYGSDMLPTAGLNYTRIADPELDVILEPLMDSSDDTLRTLNARKVQALVNENVWAIPIYPRMLHFGSRSNVHGLSFDASGWLNSWLNVWVDR